MSTSYRQIIYGDLELAGGGIFYGSAAGVTSGTLPRSAVAAGTASHVVINDGSGALSSEAQLSALRGGLGADYSGALDTGVVAFTGSGVSTLLPYGTTSVADSLVQRDGSGNVVLGDTTLDLITQADAGANNGATGYIKTSLNIKTTDATPTALYTFASTTGCAYAFHGMIVAVLAGATPGDSAMFYVQGKALHNGTSLAVSQLIQKSQIIDSNLAGVDVTVTAATANISFNATGLAATNIIWSGHLEILEQDANASI